MQAENCLKQGDMMILTTMQPKMITFSALINNLAFSQHS
jgi:hypothetical protein